MVKKIVSQKSLLPTYSVDLGNLIHMIQFKTLEKIVEEKYGQYHARIFRVLENLGFQDEKQISDLCLIPLKEARTCIVKLMTDRYIEIQVFYEKIQII